MEVTFFRLGFTVLVAVAVLVVIVGIVALVVILSGTRKRD